MTVKKLVIVPPTSKSRSIKALAKEVSKKVGHYVYRVPLASVRKRLPFVYPVAKDKLTQLTIFAQNNVSCPEFTTDRNQAASWIRDGGTVMCRTLLRASEGRGIVIAETEEALVPARLYTLYVKKKKEFRVHVLNGTVIDIQQKRKKSGFEGTRETKIRNLANGYVFCREGIEVPEGLKELAVRATASLGYSLGAVDVAYNERNNKLVVLEVNACPGLMGTTLDNYANSLEAWYRSRA
jgi:glutathione synthase/RimK-type ligase-like ATP-grasp enzyme